MLDRIHRVEAFYSLNKNLVAGKIDKFVLFGSHVQDLKFLTFIIHIDFINSTFCYNTDNGNLA